MLIQNKKYAFMHNGSRRFKGIPADLYVRLRGDYDILTFSIIWFLLLFEGRSRLFRDPGTFFHTAAGEHILRTGELIRHDPFSFTMHGKEWIAISGWANALWLLSTGLPEWTAFWWRHAS